MVKEITRAVITGATGMIGIALVEYLLSQGIEVTALIRKNSKKAERLPAHTGLYKAELDLTELSDEAALLASKILDRKQDVFFHLGWDGTFGDCRNDMYLQNNNIRYTLDAVRLAHRLECSVFVGAGSQAEYGRTEEKLSASTPTFPENGYGIAKLAAGQMSRILCQSLGIRHEWTRILSVYGAYDTENTMVMSAIRKLSVKAIPEFSKGEQLWDYLYVKDAVRALYLIAENGRDGRVYPIGSGNPRRLSEYILAIRDSMDKEGQVSLGAIPYSRNQVMYLCADISELTKETGFVPEYTFEEGIKETVQWYRQLDTTDDKSEPQKTMCCEIGKEQV